MRRKPLNRVAQRDGQAPTNFVTWSEHVASWLQHLDPETGRQDPIVDFRRSRPGHPVEAFQPWSAEDVESLEEADYKVLYQLKTATGRPLSEMNMTKVAAIQANYYVDWLGRVASTCMIVAGEDPTPDPRVQAELRQMFLARTKANDAAHCIMEKGFLSHATGHGDGDETEAAFHPSEASEQAKADWANSGEGQPLLPHPRSPEAEAVEIPESLRIARQPQPQEDHRGAWYALLSEMGAELRTAEDRESVEACVVALDAHVDEGVASGYLSNDDELKEATGHAAQHRLEQLGVDYANL